MNEHILSAYRLSGTGHAKALTTKAEIIATLKAPELAWLHLQADHPVTAEGIESYQSFLTQFITTALVADETWPALRQ